jgi:very-short-patch-repair endonuclease
LVQRAVASWTGELIDLGGRNTLLYYRDLKQGTLSLGAESGADAVAVDDLLSGRTVRLSEMFSDSTRGAAARRARTVKAKAAENVEERGIQTMFLAWGMATWTNPNTTAIPAAPVLLRQAALSARGSAGEDFDLSLPGEWEVNPTLLHLLKTEYKAGVAADDLLALLDEDAEPPEALELFERLTKAASVLVGFSVKPRVVIGNFSYARLPMVLDLENAEDALTASELICALAGDEGARTTIRERHPNTSISEPDHVPPQDEFLVLDADASQSYAINAAVGGADLVVEGPPGTGKSQTIANLIATLSARGQKILFVAEKRAAIDAVLDRLNRVGLGDLVLDLHEGAGSKRKLAADLARALHTVANLPKPDMEAAQEGLTRRRSALVAHASALHRKREPWDVSVYEILVRLRDVPPSAVSAQRLEGSVLTNLDAVTFRQSEADVEALAGLGGFALSALTSPWGAAADSASITSSEGAQQALSAINTLATHTLPETLNRFGQACRECDLGIPTTVPDLGRVVQLWKDVAASLAVFEETIFTLPLAELGPALAPATKGAFGRAGASIGNRSYRQAKKAVLGHCRGQKPKARQLHEVVEHAAATAAGWQHLELNTGLPRLPTDLAGVEGAYWQLSVEFQSVGAWTARPDLVGWTIQEVGNFLQSLLADTPTLYKLPAIHTRRSRLLAAGWGGLLGEMATRNFTVEQATACLAHVWLSSILAAISIADPEIGAFDGLAHSRTVNEYRAADRKHVETAAVRVRRAVAEHTTRTRDEYPTESDVISHQARLKRGHLPVRQLFQAAPNVLGTLKPCWAMSPLVVAQLLPAQKLFDVVIFDEASQVTPADAVGALMRADRAVVAGDPKQLPPTSFFAASSGGGEDDEDVEEQLSASAGTKNMESVLDAMSALLPPPKGTRTLGWHYRSHDERLIAFSNAQPNLYDWSLTTFPGVAGEDCIRHELVPFRPGRAGQEDSVTDEVARVVELVADHARARPDESLGVIAMGIKHANRIDEALRRARSDDAELDGFLSGEASDQARKEPFFVKNLERVQGDERDAIILTIGYGKTSDGRMLYRFGPINIEGGHRRLNVAITRARSRLTVVSSFSSADMDPNRLRSDGAQMLWRYLTYAESGGANLGDAAKAKAELNPFEADVADHLAKAGIPLIPQYGCSGYWIDFAAQHPTRPGQMVLAIECDGVSYHSAATARDRDRLRQEHLERLGWRFHRIWSQDWFYKREAEIARALDAYKGTVEAVDLGHGGYRPWRRTTESEEQTREATPPSGAPSASASETPSTPDMQGPRPKRAGRCPVHVGRASIAEYSKSELVALIRWIESDTLLRTEDELLEETVRVLGFRKKGPRIREAIQDAIPAARDPNWPARPPTAPPSPPVAKRYPSQTSWQRRSGKRRRRY